MDVMHLTQNFSFFLFSNLYCKLTLYYFSNAEYAYTLKVDEKSDVYSFGVVVLELLTGRRPVGDFGEGVDIVQWCKKVTNCRKEDVIQIVDRRLMTSTPNHNVPKEEAMHLFFIATLCVQENSIERPTMREVVQMLSELTRHSLSPDSQSSSSSKNPQKDTTKKACTNFTTQHLLV